MQTTSAVHCCGNLDPVLAVSCSNKNYMSLKHCVLKWPCDLDSEIVSTGLPLPSATRAISVSKLVTGAKTACGGRGEGVAWQKLTET